MSSIAVRTVLLANLFFGLLLAVGTVESQELRIRDAERSADEYMTAFFQGDFETAAALTHPDTLTLIQTKFFAELSSGNTTPSDVGLSLSLDELRALSAEALYVAVLQADRKRNPGFSEAMREAARVEVIGSRETPDGQVIVRLKMVTPSGPGSTHTQEGGLILRMAGSRWKVVGNAP